MRSSFILFTIVFFTFPIPAQENDSLQRSIEQIVRRSRGTVGVAVSATDETRGVLVNDSVRFPMQSVYKFHLALAVLHLVDSAQLDLTQKIYIRPEELLPETWSPLREKYPGGNISLPLSEIIRYTVAWSDNNGCDILFRLIGGTGKVHRYIRSLGTNGVVIAATEEEMHRSWPVQYTNWSTPSSALFLLKQFHAGAVLSEQSTAFLRRVMIETTTGIDRLKGLLPAGAVVAHKTGSSGRNERGITAAVNDIGIITLPNGRSVAMAVFVSNTPDPDETSERVIAETAKAVWDHYMEKQ